MVDLSLFVAVLLCLRERYVLLKPVLIWPALVSLRRQIEQCLAKKSFLL